MSLDRGREHLLSDDSRVFGEIGAGEAPDHPYSPGQLIWISTYRGWEEGRIRSVWSEPMKKGGSHSREFHQDSYYWVHYVSVHTDRKAYRKLRVDRIRPRFT